jgi:cell division protein FtsB
MTDRIMELEAQVESLSEGPFITTAALPPDPRIKELETKLKVKHDTSELRQTIRDLDRERKAERKRNGHLARRINELEAQVEQWKADYHRTASEKVKLAEKLLDMENK